MNFDRIVLDELTQRAKESPRPFLKAHHHMKGD